MHLPLVPADRSLWDVASLSDRTQPEPPLEMMRGTGQLNDVAGGQGEGSRYNNPRLPTPAFAQSQLEQQPALWPSLPVDHWMKAWNIGRILEAHIEDHS